MTFVKSLITTTLLASSLGFIAVNANAQEFEGSRNQGQQIKRLLRGLDLSVEQRQDIKQIIRETRQEAKLFREDIKLAKQEVKHIVQQPDFDEQAALSAIAASSDVKAQLGQQRAETKHSIWLLLTEEQQQQWQERIENKRQREPREFNADRQVRFFERLEFTDAQIEQATEIRQQAAESRQALNSSRQAFKQAEFDLITADEFSPEAWQALHAQYVDDFNQGQLITLQTRNQMFNLMTEEQRQKAQRLKKRKGKRGRRRGDRA